MRKVLIVDDDIEIQDLMKFTFQQMGYEVYQAYDGKQGLIKAKEVQPDVIILDILMPEMNGFEVIEEIRKDYEICLTPVIMLTSLSHTRDKLTGIKLGADEYIVKPVEPYEIVVYTEKLIKKYYENVDKLTLLPGYTSFENHIQELLTNNKEFKVIFIDICNFKTFNMKYGFDKGDIVLKLFSGILRSVVKNFGTDNDMCYRLEADDFVVVTYSNKVDSIVENIISLFNDFSKKIYDEQTLKLGYYIYTTQDGIELKSDLLKLAIAVNNVTSGEYKHYAELLTFMKEFLNVAKEQCKQTKEHYVIKS